MGLEQRDQLGKIHERADQAIDLIDHHDVDLAGLDVGEEPLEGRALESAGGEAAVFVMSP